MKKFFNNKKKTTILIGFLGFLVFGQAVLIAKLFTERDKKHYEVNLVAINTEKDSVDYLKMKNDLSKVDQSIGQLNSFLKAKSISNTNIEALDNDSISSSVYLAKQSNRYTQYLLDLQNKLMTVPLGMPTSGYVSSLFGPRKNPIPFKTALASTSGTTKKAEIASTPTPTSSAAPVAAAPVAKPVPVEKIIEVEDSYGNKRQVKVMVTPKVAAAPTSAPAKTTPQVASKSTSGSAATKPVVEKNNAPAEPDQIQFHKGLDIAVPYGSDVWASASGTVIFAGEKGGYGNCVIISHGNGLATLYAHLSTILVDANDKVKVGEVIAKSGNSGRSTGPHLHYEVHKNNTPVNPKLFINL